MPSKPSIMPQQYNVLCFYGYMDKGTMDATIFERTLQRAGIEHCLETVPKPIVDAYGLRNRGSATGDSNYCTLGLILKRETEAAVRKMLEESGRVEDKDFIMVPVNSPVENKELALQVDRWNNIDWVA